MERDPAQTFEQFVKSFRTSLRLDAAAMCGDWHAAEDFVQEALVILHRRWSDIEPSARRAYTHAVALHLVTRAHGCIGSKRKSGRDVLPDLALPWLLEEEVANRLAVKDAIAGLPARQRNAVYLRYWEGLSCRSIAQMLHVPAGTVRSDLSRAIVQLRDVLQVSFP